LGVVEFALTALNAAADSGMQFLHEQTLVPVNEALGNAEFQAAWKVLGNDEK
jgi:hypothetical protein